MQSSLELLIRLHSCSRSSGVIVSCIPRFDEYELTCSPLYWIWKGWKDRSCRCCQDFDSHYFGGKLASASTDSQAYWQLGGKSPTIVAADANMRLTARRMMSIKPMSGSQICGKLSPDKSQVRADWQSHQITS
jgi:hypothetical protein